jgi:long-chain acyl-CoA synthetase
VEEAYAKSPAISEIGVLQRDDRLVAVIVPATRAGQGDSDGEVERAIRDAVADVSETLTTYQRIADFVISREPLPRTRLDKIRRHELEERYLNVKEGKERQAETPMTIEEMSGSDRELLDDPATREVWNVLARRYDDRRLTPNASLQLELGIDSLEWRSHHGDQEQGPY